ncbi:unnamed protein product, partial [Owenia fusiformis]
MMWFSPVSYTDGVYINRFCMCFSKIILGFDFETDLQLCDKSMFVKKETIVFLESQVTIIKIYVSQTDFSTSLFQKPYVPNFTCPMYPVSHDICSLFHMPNVSNFTTPMFPVS